MKKSLFLLFASISFIAANAQQITSKKGFPVLPEKGDWAISFNADGLFSYIGDIGFNTNGEVAPQVDAADYKQLDKFNTGIYFVGKKFITDKTAYRAVVRLNVNNVSQKTDYNVSRLTNPTDDNKFTNTYKNVTRDVSLTVGLGKEWRRGKTRLQGYYGADVLLQIASDNYTKQTNSLTTKTNDLNNFDYAAQSGVAGRLTSGLSEKKSRDGLKFGLGAQAFIGAEYFVLPKMAIGAQYDAVFLVSLQGKSKNSETNWDGKTTETKGSSTTTIGIGQINVTSIRLSLYF